MDSKDVWSRLNDLSYADRVEVVTAVSSGRAVRKPELAELAADYAHVTTQNTGAVVFRKWWYLAALVAAPFVAAFSALGLVGAGVIAVVMLVGPFFLRGRRQRARVAEVRNRVIADR